MIVPQPTTFALVPIGGVFTPSDGSYQMKTDATSQVNLANGAIGGGIPSDRVVTYFAGATLLL